MRKFEIISDNEILKNQDLLKENIILPCRQTKKSAGYDFYLPYDVLIEVDKKCIVKTGIKVCLEDDEVLEIYIRSSMAFKKNLLLINQVGIIDADYYNNIDNEGHIMIGLINNGTEDVLLHRGERIAQGVFKKFLLTDNDDAQALRYGGIGSTKK